MTWRVTETHHLSVIQVFELQGCNVSLLVCKDLFQIVEAEGSVVVCAGGAQLTQRSMRQEKNNQHTYYMQFNDRFHKEHRVISCMTLWRVNLAFAFVQMCKC